MAGISLTGWGASLSAKTEQTPKITMFKSPTCGCCGKWAEAARAAGFEVETVPSPDMRKVKAQLQVPAGLLSCHTSVVDRYVLEGHVPIESIRKLLRTRPDVRGIGIAGMPIGTPGMEIPNVPAQDFQVMAFKSDGKMSRFS